MLPLRNLGRFFRKTIQQPGYALKVANKRVKACGYYHLGGGHSSFPEAITLFFTHRCNLRCKMCGQWGESGVTKSMDKEELHEELSFEELKKVIDDAAPFKPNFTLFGGEPLLFAHCLDTIKYLKEKGLHCLMITNGSMVGMYAKALVDAGLNELNVSLDGGQDLHNEIRGMPNLFEKITKGLKEVTQYKKETGAKKPFINLQCTITKYNYEMLEQLIDVASDIEANSLTYHNLIFINQEIIEKQKVVDERLMCSSHEWEGFIFEPEMDTEKLYQKMLAIQETKHPFNVDFYPNLTKKSLNEYYNNPSYLPTGYSPRCMSPWICAYVFPNGDVRPCLNSSYSFGNTAKESFPDIWNSEKAQKYRQILKQSKIFPACIRCTELYRY
ncbi:MAG: radical SAM protein [Candidatus Omnitrophica bacterium]|nr:radical SAM protein [Candidatus Omnitrophota bacterium]